jgi:hypothetical protein
MTRDILPPILIGGTFRYRLWKEIAIVFGTGFLCAISSISINFLVVVFVIRKHFEKINDLGSIFEIEFGIVLKYISAFTIGPILETLLFILIWMIIKGLNLVNNFKYSLFVIIMSSLSWLLHGSDWMAVSRCFGFFILSLLFVRYCRSSGVKVAFWATAAAHSFWNMNALAIISLIGFIRGH